MRDSLIQVELREKAQTFEAKPTFSAWGRATLPCKGSNSSFSDSVVFQPFLR